MKSSVELLDEIIEMAGDEWKKYLDLYLKRETEDDEETCEYVEYFDTFIETYKEDLLDNKKKNLTQIEKKLNNDLLSANLKNYMDKILEAYHAINPLRVLEVQDIDKAKEFLDFAFAYEILRFDPDAKEKACQKFELEKEEITAVMGVLDSLCTFIVSRNLHSDAMGEVIRYNTRLSKELSTYIAEAIEYNFDKLQMKIVVEKLFR